MSQLTARWPTCAWFLTSLLHSISGDTWNWYLRCRGDERLWVRRCSVFMKMPWLIDVGWTQQCWCNVVCCCYQTTLLSILIFTKWCFSLDVQRNKIGHIEQKRNYVSFWSPSPLYQEKQNIKLVIYTGRGTSISGENMQYEISEAVGGGQKQKETDTKWSWMLHLVSPNECYCMWSRNATFIILNN